MKLYFATTNKNKVREAVDILKPFRVEQVDIDYPEIRSESPEEIAVEGAKYVFEKIKKPCFVEDSGIFIHSLNNFPGTYSAYVFKKIGNDGILSLMAGKRDRGAKFISVVAYLEPASEPKVFRGEVRGEISKSPRGKGGFGYDPIFILEGYNKTFAELPNKNQISHRYLALKKLRDWLNG